MLTIIYSKKLQLQTLNTLINIYFYNFSFVDVYIFICLSFFLYKLFLLLLQEYFFHLFDFVWVYVCKTFPVFSFFLIVFTLYFFFGPSIYFYKILSFTLSQKF